MTHLELHERPANAPDLPRDEMAFRRRYEQLLLERRITTVFRPGVRVHPNWRGYREGETVTARIIARSGSDELGVPPLFTGDRVPIVIERLEVLEVGALTADHFAGSSPDVRDVPSLLAHLESIYGKPISAFGGCVTRIGFSYPSQAWRRPRWSPPRGRGN